MKFRDFSRPVQIRIILRFISVITNTAVMPFIILFFANEIGSVKVTILTLIIGAIGYNCRHTVSIVVSPYKMIR